MSFAAGFFVGAVLATATPIGCALLAARIHEWNLERGR